ncbi:hypothetical protein ACOME3_003401 [Neoechinorhynchus agilis]
MSKADDAQRKGRNKAEGRRKLTDGSRLLSPWKVYQTLSTPTGAALETGGAEQKQALEYTGVARTIPQTAELNAAIRALEIAVKAGKQSLTVRTDSQFMIDCMTKWISGWKKNGWLLRKRGIGGKQESNRDDLVRLDYLCSQIPNLKWEFVRAHQKLDMGNEWADRLAKAGAEKHCTTEMLHKNDVYIDGCCLQNGTGDAVAGIGVYWSEGSPWNVTERVLSSYGVTNNKAEILAAIRAVGQAIEQNFTILNVHTDSLFLVQCMTEWIPKWIKNGWIKSDGDSVKNKEELNKLYNLSQQLKIHWIHVRREVKAHFGIHGNEIADRLAKEAVYKHRVLKVYVVGKETSYEIQSDHPNLQKTQRLDSTNASRSEFRAVIDLIRLIDSIESMGECEVWVSQGYVYNCLSKWLIGWHKNGKWLTKSGSPVRNKDLLSEIAGLLDQTTTRIVWKLGVRK